MNSHLVSLVIERAGRLVGLALAPAVLPAEPIPPANPTLAAFFVVLVMGLVVAAANRLRVRIASRSASAGSALVIVSLVVSIICAAYFRDARAPLGRGVLFVAIPLWLGLALCVWATLRARFPDKPAIQSTYAAIAAGAIGFIQLGISAPWLGSTERMWAISLTRVGNGDRAIEELTRTNRDPAFLQGILDRCIANDGKQCACLSRRSTLRIRTRDYENAIADARAAVASCAGDAGAHVALSIALSSKGEVQEAEQIARNALGWSNDPRLQYALAAAVQSQGRIPEATDLARKAVEQGAGRDAQMLLAALCILTGDLDTAVSTLNTLIAASPNDAEARYNLALIADKKNDYNGAREGYLAALRIDPSLANARYNLALLTLRRGIVEESRHHARKFAEMLPGDPRIPELMKRVDAAKPGRP
jgi:tetratricopeptide (TPR) repeat protein